MTAEKYRANQLSLLAEYSARSAALMSQLDALDWDELYRACEQCISKEQSVIPSSELEAPVYVELDPVDEENQKLHQVAAQEGEVLIRNGKIALFTVAGGQGTRLNHPGPKGTFPVSPIKNKPLFQIFAERLGGLSRKYGTRIPWFIMCSPLNVKDTRAYFEQNDYFSLEPESVTFLIQDVMPIIDHHGNLVLSSEDSLSFSPNGHGGSIKALNTPEATKILEEQGIEHISYHQVDNPLYNLLDPLFIGLHSLNHSDMSSRALIKNEPLEKLGNFVFNKVHNQLSIIEYSDFPSDLAHEKDREGRLKYRAGSPAMHLFRRDFIQRISELEKLPYHRADKYVDHLNNTSNEGEPNCIKLETFIFDALSLASNPLILEAKRNESFSPVKNRTGVDSIESSKLDQLKLAHQWIKSIDPAIPDSARFEIDPFKFPTSDEITIHDIPLAIHGGLYYIS